MRVVFLNPSGAIGGGERSLLNLIESLRLASQNVEPRLVVLGDGPLVKAANAAAIPTRVVPLPARLAGLGDSGARGRGLRGLVSLAGRAVSAGPAAAGFSRRLGGVIRAERPDVVHTNGLKAHLLAAVAVPRAVPVVWHVRDFVGLRPTAAALLRFARRRSRGAIAISRSVAADLRRAVPGLAVATVLNGIDVDHFVPGPDSVPGRQSVRVGLVATFARWKGHDVFLRAAALLTARRPDLQVDYHVIGGPIYQTAGSQFTVDELRKLANDLGLTDRVTFTGFLSDPAAAYRGLDLVVHASTLPEPFGLTVVEGMSTGKAVIVSAAGGAAELFTEGVDAVGVPPGDAPALAAAVERLATDPEFRRRVGAAARATAVLRFDRRSLGPNVLRAYEHFAKRSGRRQNPN